MFDVTSSGDIVLRRSLDYETEENYVFQVYATDGTMNATANVNISVLNVNDWDPRFRYPQYEFFVPEIPRDRELHTVGGEEVEGEGGLVVGKVEAADGDRGDYITLSLRGPNARMFTIDDSGEIKIKDLSALNSSTAHLVAVATDNGLPPRQASVPVIVHLPEAVIWRAGNAWVGGASFIVMIVFGSILSVLALIIVILILYIHKHKKPKSGSREGKSNGMITNQIEPEKLPPATRNEDAFGAGGKVENPVYGTTNLNHTTPTVPRGSSPYTATVKSIMARNSTSRMTQGGHQAIPPPGSRLQIIAHNPNKQKVAPAPPQVPHTDSSRTPSPEARNNNLTGGPPGAKGTGGISWPMGSIPRRVKKLSWDDESDSSNAVGTRSKMEMDPDVSVTPLGPDFKTSDQMNLTVYF